MIVFHFKTKDKKGESIKKTFILDRSDTMKVEQLKSLLSLQLKRFSYDGLRIDHYRGDTFIVTANT